MSQLQPWDVNTPINDNGDKASQELIEFLSGIVRILGGEGSNSVEDLTEDATLLALAVIAAQDDVNHLVTLSGAGVDADHLGTFTGSTISDNKTVKVALQELETLLETINEKVGDLITLSGVAANATDLGTFTGSKISDNIDIKAALQEIETEVETHHP
ncbi:MAG: hypothetical protein COB36_11610 [Alphaproteobacteria bacterium]|nr:MAG: hypothetical protein COB36_11610 [Alphaproteobacteria bacterium]